MGRLFSNVGHLTVKRLAGLLIGSIKQAARGPVALLSFIEWSIGKVTKHIDEIAEPNTHTPLGVNHW